MTNAGDDRVEACTGKVLVIHGPNLNLLGKREPATYGVTTLEDINTMLNQRAGQLGLQLTIVQTNHEGIMIDTIQEAQDKFSCIIINPAAFTHYSVAVRDALAAISVPAIEVHMSNIYRREEFRHHSVVSPVAVGQIAGFGANSYLLALEAASCLLRSHT
ncbi:MAG: yqhS [Sporomusa sp.]|jgi:3-dehydroquinate dehydratase-2|nr:yqhS [Sporomusa sp.]